VGLDEVDRFSSIVQMDDVYLLEVREDGIPRWDSGTLVKAS
jgi:hypothetical protein